MSLIVEIMDSNNNIISVKRYESFKELNKEFSQYPLKYIYNRSLGNNNRIQKNDELYGFMNIYEECHYLWNYLDDLCEKGVITEEEYRQQNKKYFQQYRTKMDNCCCLKIKYLKTLK
jgi:hypothetical protein